MQQRLAEFEALGVRPIAISVDSPAVTREHTQKMGFTYTFLSDPKGDTIRTYDLAHEGGGMEGGPVARPAEFLIDRTGTVRWRNLTDDYRVRARVEAMLAASRGL